MIKKENAKVAPGTLNDRAEKKRKQSSWLIAGGTLSGIPLSIAYFSLGSTLPWLAAMVGVPAAFFGAGLAAARKADALNQEASAKIKGEKPDPAKLLEQAQKISQRGGFFVREHTLDLGVRILYDDGGRSWTYLRNRNRCLVSATLDKYCRHRSGLHVNNGGHTNNTQIPKTGKTSQGPYG